jgi:hypothetical protein
MPEQTEGAIDASAPSRRPLPSDEPSIQLALARAATPDSLSAVDGNRRVGDYVPFKQCRLEGQSNPFRPPLHVETVLIGRALCQATGYLCGVGFRVRDDGYVEAEFADGVRRYDTYEEFEIEVTDLARTKSL